MWSLPSLEISHFLVLLKNGWLDKLWTSNPEFVQSLSNVCPIFVPSLSNSKIYPQFVQSLSRKLFLSPMIVQSKSRVCLVLSLSKASEPSVLRGSGGDGSDDVVRNASPPRGLD